MKKMLIATGVASLAVAAMPVVGVFAADITEVVDTLNITISPTCSFDGETPNADTTDKDYDAANTYSATALNGAKADFNGDTAGGDTVVHNFSVTCNDNDGWKVTASAVPDLAGTGTNNHKFTYVSTTLPTEGTEGSWTAVVGGDFSSTSDETITGIANATNAILKTGGVIAAEHVSAKTSAFTVTYSAYAGTETAADTYTGSVTYTLAVL